MGTGVRWQTWLQTARVQSWAIATISVLAGAGVAWWEGHVSALALLAWLTAVAAQAGTNLTNVSFNYKAGAARDGAHLDPQGSSAPVRGGQLTPQQVRRGARWMFGVAAIAGIATALLSDWRLLIVGALGCAAGWYYAAPPVRLAYRALGVVTVFVFFGPAMVAGTAYVISGRISGGAWCAAIAVGLMAADVMHINDLRDLDGDLAHGKITLTTLLGRTRSVALLIAMIVGAYIAVGVAVWQRWLPATTLLPVFAAPIAVRQVGVVLRERDPALLNAAWFLGVKLHTAFGVALLLGLAIGR